MSVTGQTFSPVTTLSSSFSGDPIDGILGLAFPAISNLNAVSLYLPSLPYPFLITPMM